MGFRFLTEPKSFLGLVFKLAVKKDSSSSVRGILPSPALQSSYNQEKGEPELARMSQSCRNTCSLLMEFVGRMGWRWVGGIWKLMELDGKTLTSFL